MKPIQAITPMPLYPFACPSVQCHDIIPHPETPKGKDGPRFCVPDGRDSRDLYSYLKLHLCIVEVVK